MAVLAITLALSCSRKGDASSDSKIIVAYVTSWSDAMPDPEYMTHINYAFGHVSDSFDGVRIDNEERLRKIVALKKIKPELKVMLSIGGWESGRFSEMAADDGFRMSFAKDCRRVIDEFGLDGVDIDWEYPTSSAAGISSSPEDTDNFTLLMRDVREMIGKAKCLTIASVDAAKFIDFEAILPYVDFVNVMSYDMAGAPKHHAALYPSENSGGFTASKAIEAHLAAGVPASKLTMGVPFYGRGTAPYDDFVDYGKFEILPGCEDRWDDVAKAPYVANEEGALVLGYENSRSIAFKCQYIKDNDLLGGMYWDYAGDNARGDLRRAVRKGLSVSSVPPACGKVRIFRMRLDHDIDNVARDRVTKALSDAVDTGADCFLLDLDTYGGELSAADSIRSAILRCEIPTAVFVNMQAASAGALISIACDSIYMRTGSTMGAATVVNGMSGEPMPDKYQSFMRGMMRATAEATGRDPEVAQSMVDTAHVLSLTPSEAMEAGYCQRVCDSKEEVAEVLAGGGEYEFVEFHQSGAEKAAETMMAFRFIFLLMIFGGIYIEMKAPGVGLPLAVAILGAVLYFSPLYIVHLAQNWEIALFIVGLVLLGMELFVIPGFGICGVTGIVSVVVSLTFAAVDNSELFRLDGTFDIKPVLIPFGEVVICLAVAVFGGVYLVHKLYYTKAFNNVALRESLDESEGFVGVKTGLGSLVGSEAEVFTDLKPAGKVLLGGKVYEATLNVGYALKGERVVVKRAEQGRLYCEKVKKLF